MRPNHPDWSCTTKPQLYHVRVLPKPPAAFADIQAVNVGPLTLADSQGSINNRYWVCYQLSGVVYMRGAVNDTTWSAPETILTEAEEIEALDFTFDQLGRAIIFYQVGTELRLWYFDSIAGEFIKRVIDADAEQPLCGFDLIDDTGDPMSDAHIFYVKGGSILERLQRDRYDVVYDSLVSYSSIKLLSCGMTAGNKFQVEYRYKNQRNALEKRKVYETENPAIVDFTGNDIEIGFSIGPNFNSDCHRQDDVYLMLFEQTFADIGEFSLGVSVGISITNPEFQYLIVGRNELPNPIPPGFDERDYGIFEIPIRIIKGDYRFLFLNTGTLGRKLFKFYQNGVLKVEYEIGYIVDYDPRQSLKFGASAIPNVSTGNYRYCLKAQFLNMYCIVNGARTDWPITAGLPVVTPSVPAGNTMTVYVDGKNGVRVY